MILFHGSRVKVSKPDIFHSRKKVDFGVGFYATPILEQAKSLCQRYLKIGLNAYVSKYNFDDKALNEFKVLEFDSYSLEWLEFVLACRKDEDKSDYDIIIGGVADDRVFDTVELYFADMISKDEALKRLKYAKPNLQICFRNQKVIDKYLTYIESVKL